MSILWLHKWRPIMFAFLVEDFEVECVGEEHVKVLTDTPRQY